MNITLILPLVIPLCTAALGLVLYRWPKLQKWLGLLGSTGLLISGILLLNRVLSHGIQTTQIGNWPAPFGIVLVSDLFSALMVLVVSIIGFCTMLYSLPERNQKRNAFGYSPLLQILILGVCGTSLTGDLFNLYVWFEVILISSFVLLIIGKNKKRFNAGLKYVSLNLISSLIFLIGTGFIYGTTGTLNMADIARTVHTAAGTGPPLAGSILLSVAFGIKAGVFPLFFWLPDSYYTGDPDISAVFAGLLTKVGVYALIRVFTLMYPGEFAVLQPLFFVIAGLTMVIGVLGAISKDHIRKILSIHVISQIGYMIMGLAIFTPLALAATLFFLFHNIIVKTVLFLVSGVVKDLKKSENLGELGGLSSKHPYLSGLFLVSAFSLAGLPPLSGFFGKYFLVLAGFRAGAYEIAALALVVSILTLFSMMKIWTQAFWGENKSTQEHANPDESISKSRNPTGENRVLPARFIPLLCLVGLSLFVGFAADPIFEVTREAADQLLNPSNYIHTVLNSS